VVAKAAERARAKARARALRIHQQLEAKAVRKDQVVAAKLQGEEIPKQAVGDRRCLELA
jgi:hypothetical protein